MFTKVTLYNHEVHDLNGYNVVICGGTSCVMAFHVVVSARCLFVNMLCY